MSNRRKGLVVAGLVALFAAPLLLALILRTTGWTPGSTDNHGRLVRPPVALAVGGDDRLAKRWVVVYVPRRPCGEACQRTVGALQRVHRGLGRDAHRVVMALGGAVPEPVGFAEVARSGWLDDLAEAAPGGLSPGAAYLLDPRGYLVMWYQPGFDPAGLLEDLETLLRYSRVGVQ